MTLVVREFLLHFGPLVGSDCQDDNQLDHPPLKQTVLNVPSLVELFGLCLFGGGLQTDVFLSGVDDLIDLSF